MGLGVRLEGWLGWLRWSAHPLGGAVCRVRVQYPAFGSWLLRNGSWVFGLFVSCCS